MTTPATHPHCPAAACPIGAPCVHFTPGNPLEIACEELGITLTATLTEERRDTPGDTWRIVLKRGAMELETPFFQGTGFRDWQVTTTWHGKGPMHSTGWRKAKDAKELPRHIEPTVYNLERAWYRPKEPTVADVIACLCSDAACVAHGQTLADFCADLGLDADSRKAEETYRNCQTTALRLRGFLGDAYDDVTELAAGY